MNTPNYVIYHRNNKMLGLTNHIDNDGDLDDNYALLRNTALTGRMINGSFISLNSKRFVWLIECATKGCPICNGIFMDVSKKDYNIKPFYMEKVLKIKNNDDLHPLYDHIIKTFKGTEIE